MDIGTLKTILSPILESHGAEKAILFGSYARSTEDKRSDVDLIIIDEENLPYLKRLDKYFNDISDVLKMPLDIFVYKRDEFEEMKQGCFVRQAVEEGVTLYER